MGKLFGTDGVRGVANKDLTCEMGLKIGVAVARTLKKEMKKKTLTFLIGSDTRIFVKKVLDYANNKKKEKLFDDELFSKLNEFNEKIINIFLKGINDNTILLKESCINYRNILRKISEESHVDIEPKILTSLLNNLIKNH